MAIKFQDGRYVDENGRVTLDPTVYKDWQIAEEAEKTLPSVEYFREKLGLLPEEIIPYGNTPKLDFMKIMIPVTLGNLLGGVFVGFIVWFCWLRKRQK